MKLLLLAGLAGVTAAVALSAAAEAPREQCLRTSYLRNHTVGDASTMYWDYNGRAVYRLTMSNACLSAAISSDPIVLRDRGVGYLCHPIDWDITVRGSRCIVSGMDKLSPAEVAALPKGKHP
jgi:hypothetical protein